MKICIAGKNNIAVDCLEYIQKFYPKSEICVVVNKTDQFKNTWQKSLGFYARKYEIPILTLDQVMLIEGIIFFSIEFDTIVRPKEFKSEKLYNIHFSLLPEYKGMYTSILPILDRKNESGVTLHSIDNGIDTGDIIDQIKFKLQDDYTSRVLYSKYLKVGVEIFIKNLDNIISHKYNSVKQSHVNSTYFSKKAINFLNTELNPRLTASQIAIFVNAFNFRVYQTAKFRGRGIIKTVISSDKSILIPGEVIEETFDFIKIATIDYDIKLFYDFYNELFEFCKYDLVNKAKRLNFQILDISETDENGWSPIIIAAYYGSFEVLKLLLKLGANINTTNLNGTSILMYSCSNFLNHKNFKIIEFLLENGANVHLHDIHGLTIFDYCKNKELLTILNKYK
jgi:methionyl-tRNA formyltransferase